MNKQEIIDALNAKGVTFDPAQTKAELAALLGSAVGKPGDEAGKTDTTGTPPAGEPEKPAEDKPAESIPAATEEQPVDIAAADAAVAELHRGADVSQAATPFVEFLAEREMLPEEEIIEKVKAGLTREQAVEVLNNQREHDGKPPLSAAQLDEARDDSGDIPESEIIEKVRAGLTRPQAIEVIHNQRAHEKAGRR